MSETKEVYEKCEHDMVGAHWFDVDSGLSDDGYHQINKHCPGAKRIVLQEAMWCSTHHTPATEPKDAETCRLEELAPPLWVEVNDDE